MEGGSGETKAKAEGEETGAGVGAGEGSEEGLERVSVTTFSGPEMWTTELVGEVALLVGGPRQRHSKQCMSERFVVSTF